MKGKKSQKSFIKEFRKLKLKWPESIDKKQIIKLYGKDK